MLADSERCFFYDLSYHMAGKLKTGQAAAWCTMFVVLVVLFTAAMLMIMGRIADGEQRWLDHELRVEMRAVSLRFRTGDLIFINTRVGRLAQSMVEVHQQTRFWHVGVVFVDTDGTVYGSPMVAYLCEYLATDRHMTARPLGARLARFLPGRAAVRRAGRQVPSPDKLREFLRAHVPVRSHLGPPQTLRCTMDSARGYVSRFVIGCPEDASGNCMDAAVQLLRQAGLWISATETVSHVDELLHGELSHMMPGVQPPELIVLANK